MRLSADRIARTLAADCDKGSTAVITSVTPTSWNQFSRHKSALSADPVWLAHDLILSHGFYFRHPPRHAGCQAELLLDFIKTIECETLYLVGDIVDGWMLKRGWRWPQAHSDVVQKILRLARKGVTVVYVPGNHDDRIRDFCGVHFGGVMVMRDAIHEAADGKRYLVTHGDEFDGIVEKAKWLAYLGDYSYRALLTLNTQWNTLRRRLGLGYWSLSAFVKLKVKNAVKFIDDFENAVADEAKRRGVDGVICGHIHHAEMREIDGILYVNDGDWVESCTAVVEHHDGKLEVVEWAKARGWSMLAREVRPPSSAPLPEPAFA